MFIIIIIIIIIILIEPWHDGISSVVRIEFLLPLHNYSVREIPLFS
jgi:hypothetical protein